MLLILGVLSSRFGFAQSPVTLDTNEALFTVLTAINACGYDAELVPADPVRMTIRGEVGHNIEVSEKAKAAADAVCSFYHDHQQKTDTLTLSEYVSLGLFLNTSEFLTETSSNRSISLIETTFHFGFRPQPSARFIF